jgi:hypothetical protein
LLFRKKTKKHEERTCVTKDNNQQIGNRIGHRKGKENRDRTWSHAKQKQSNQKLHRTQEKTDTEKN